MTAAGERRAPPGGILYWTPFILAAAVLQAGWLLLKAADAARPAHHRTPPVTHFLPAPTSVTGARDLAPDARTLWSPILFSLPTPQGFSGALDDHAGARPPLRHPDAPPALWPNSAPTGPAPGPVRLAALQRQAAVYLETFAAPSPADPRWKGAGQPPVPSRVVFSDGITGDDFEAMPLPEVADAAAPLELQARLEFDARGLPVRVLIDPPAADAATGARAVRALLAWRMKPGIGPRQCTVRLRGAAPETAP